MLCFATLLSMGWDNFFSGKEHTTTNGETTPDANNVRITTTGNVEVFKCNFNELHITDVDTNGGAICIQGSCAMLVDYCLFSKCTSNEEGGAIYFKKEEGGLGCECAITRVCAGECTAVKRGQFCFIETKTEGVNSVYYSSIIKSSEDGIQQSQFTGGETLHLYYGNTEVINTNISNNKCKWYPALSYTPGTRQNVIRFCSIASNKATYESSSISSLGGEGAKLIEKCNVILNRVNYQTKTKGNIFTVTGDLTVKGSCLLSNVAEEFFKNNENVDKRIQLYDCTFDEMNINKASFVKKETPPFILGINMLKTAFCSASYDSLPEGGGGGPKIEVIPADEVERTAAYKRKLVTGCFKTAAIQLILIYL